MANKVTGLAMDAHNIPRARLLESANKQCMFYQLAGAGLFCAGGEIYAFDS